MMNSLLVPRSVVLGRRTVKHNRIDQGFRLKRKQSSVQTVPVSKRARNTTDTLYSNVTDESLDSNTDKYTSNDSIDVNDHYQSNDTPLNDNTIEQSDIENEPVKEFAYYQRPALPDEPVCVVCGRYGEYINDTTDHDVCSLECKAKDIQQRQRIHAPIDVATSISSSGSSVPPIYRPVDRFHAHLVAYQAHPSMATLSNEEMDALRTVKQIKARGRHIPPLLSDFNHLTLPEQLRVNLEEAGYTAPTPIQMQVIPAALAARDIVAAAPTGSGKTLSFLLPCIIHACALSNAFHHEGRPYMFIIAPTHDLCAQLEMAAQQLCKGLPEMRTALITGEHPIPPQWHRLRRGVALVFGTPGRLDRILETWPSMLKRPRADIIVLDEVDRLVDSAEKESLMHQILGKLTSTDMPSLDGPGYPHQLMLFSATRAWRTRRVFKSWLHDPIRIAIGELDMITPDVRQTFFWVENNSKKKRLFLLFNDPVRYPLPAIVFVESRIGAELLAKAIVQRCPGIRAHHVHGETSSKERESVMQAGRDGSTDVIVATSGLWSRGIDIPKVRLVINFDMPRHLDEYIHQVGRAGRAGELGRSISFINDDSKNLFRELLEMLRSLSASKVDPLPVELRRYSTHYHRSIDTILANPHSRINQPKSAFKFILPPNTPPLPTTKKPRRATTKSKSTKTLKQHVKYKR